MIKKEIAIANEKARLKAIADAKNNTKPSSNNKSDVAVTRPVTRTPKKTESVLVSSEADRILDANFERNRGSLPWPADGFILSHFGTNVLTDRVEYNDPGVGIGTSVGGAVKAIFDGEVTLVNSMEDKQVVFIKHGKYFTVYSNLASANVARGQTVKTGQVVGRAGANDNGQGEIDLIIMKENTNVNPEQWLRRK